MHIELDIDNAGSGDVLYGSSVWLYDQLRSGTFKIVRSKFAKSKLPGYWLKGTIDGKEISDPLVIFDNSGRFDFPKYIVPVFETDNNQMYDDPDTIVLSIQYTRAAIQSLTQIAQQLCNQLNDERSGDHSVKLDQFI